MDNLLLLLYNFYIGMVMQMYRNTYARIDINVLKNNIKNIKKEYPDYDYYFGVVKGNAYGHGDYIVNSLIESGINYLAVSSLEEALSIRKYNKEIPILVLELINIKYLDVCVENNITITLSDFDYYKKLINSEYLPKLKIHLKIETGMNRLGLDNRDNITEIVNNNKLNIEGIYTHFATSGYIDKHWDNQLQVFKDLTSNIDLSKIKIVHLGRSNTLTTHNKIPFCNGIRLGIVMYGFNNKISLGSGLKGKIRAYKNKLTRKLNNISEPIDANLKVETAFSLYTEVMQVKKCKKGSFIGYGANYRLEEDSYIATLPIGYFDGVNNFKHVVINNKTYNIIGEVCMDMIMVKVDDSVKVGDKVCLFGKKLPLRKVCNDAGISAYKLLTGISNRVPRIYIDNDKILEEKRY